MTHLRAMLCGLAAFFAWVLVDTAIKLGAQAALSPFVIMAVLGSVGAVGIALRAVAKKETVRLRPRNMRSQIIVCACSLTINYVNIIALKHLPLTIFYIVVFTMPFVTAALSVIFRHEKLTLTKTACIATGFIGVVIAIAPSINGAGEWIGYAAALTSVVAFAISTITINKIAQGSTAESTQFINAAVVAAVGIICAVGQGADWTHGQAVILMIIAGVVNMAANLLYNVSLQHTSSTNIAQLHYTQIVSGALIAYLIWHEVPTPSLIAGSVLIVGSGLIVAHRARKNDQAGNHDWGL